ncbi:Dynactin, isoform [Sphaceloma murrayae]|uniref:Dynactin, isoform n=1 Tax=Sphaceloma murrayae TaxID=2082308 RepID=A0A2K1QHE0_9PEZI|nr:Dynactin, isoform [Sphaceloma murrayae]
MADTWKQAHPYVAPPASPPHSPVQHFHHPTIRNTRIPRAKDASPTSSPSPSPASSPSPRQSDRQRRRHSSISVHSLRSEDAGYQSELEVLYPDETEDGDSDGNDDDKSQYLIAVPGVNQSGESGEESGLEDRVLSRLRRLKCDNGPNDRCLPVEMRHRRKAVGTSTRGPKRSHSQSVDAGEEVDSGAWDDQGVEGGERRLRRKVFWSPGSSLAWSDHECEGGARASPDRDGDTLMEQMDVDD